MPSTMTVHTIDGFPGHFYVELNDGAKSTYGGFYPADGFHDLSAATAVPGQFHDDDNDKHGNDANHLASQPIAITDNGAQNVRDYFDKVRDSPGAYDLYNRNCVDFANGALAAAGTGKDVGAVLSPAQQDQIGAAEVYRNSKYPDNSGLTYPMPPAPGDISSTVPNPFLDSPLAKQFPNQPPSPSLNLQMPPAPSSGHSDAGTTSTTTAQTDSDNGTLTDQEIAELTPNFAPDSIVLAGLDA